MNMLGRESVGLHNLHDAWRSDSKVRWYIRIRLWVPSLLFAIMTLWAVAPAYRRRKRQKLGLCVKCGYDLRVEGAVSGVWGRIFKLGRYRQTLPV